MVADAEIGSFLHFNVGTYNEVVLAAALLKVSQRVQICYPGLDGLLEFDSTNPDKTVIKIRNDEFKRFKVIGACEKQVDLSKKIIAITLSGRLRNFAFVPKYTLDRSLREAYSVHIAHIPPTKKRR